MTRTRRTTALLAAATLALGLTACHPPSENDSTDPAPVTDVTPDRGYEGAGVPTTSGESSAADEEELVNENTTAADDQITSDADADATTGSTGDGEPTEQTTAQ